MFGNNPKRPPTQGDGQSLDIQEIFPTLQGEGPYAGWPAVFIRLGGCNLACAFCDTEFESYTPQPLAHILQHVGVQACNPQGQRTRHLIVITGGEPLRQPIAPLCHSLLQAGFAVQIESNGTLWRPLPDPVDVILSPKQSNGQYHPLRPDALAHATALKFIISTRQPGYDTVPEVGQNQHPQLPIYVQPMDEYDAAQNHANQQLALQLAEKHGYRLSLQLHKFLSIP